jgi:hypothetical protein
MTEKEREKTRASRSVTIANARENRAVLGGRLIGVASKGI